MQVYLAPDSDLRAFAIAPRTLQMWLRYPHSYPALNLHEAWRDLDAILAGEPALRDRPPLRPQGADYTYPFVADRGAHGLSSTSAAQLLQSLDRISRPQIEAYIRQRHAARVTPAGAGSGPAPPGLAAETEALLQPLAGLRASCTAAAEKKYGLLMALWEAGPA